MPEDVNTGRDNEHTRGGLTFWGVYCSAEVRRHAGEKRRPMPTTSIPAAAQNQLRAAVDTALSQPAGVRSLVAPKAPDLSAVADVKDKVLEGINAVLSAIDTIQRFAWVLPPNAIGPIQTIEDALTKVRGWLD
jgi:hypothetical protein